MDDVQEHDAEPAFQFLESEIAALRQAKDGSEGRLTAAVANLAMLHALRGNVDRAEELVDEATRVSRDAKDDRERGLALIAMARSEWAAASGRTTEAVRHAVAAADLLRRLPMTAGAMEPLQWVLDRLVGFRDTLGLVDDALDAAAEGVRLRCRRAREEPATHAAAVPPAMRVLAARLVGLGRIHDAIHLSLECLDSLQDPAAQADLLDDISVLHAESGDDAAALDAAQRSVDLYRATDPDSPDRETGLAAAVLNLATRLARAGHVVAAEAAAREAVLLWRRRVEHDGSALSRSNLAAALDNHGNRLGEIDRDAEAFSATDEAVRIRRRLTAEHPREYDQDLARTLGNRANRERKLGMPDAAVTYAEAITAYRAAAEDTVHSRYEFATCLLNAATAWADIGRTADALTAAREAAALFEALPGIYGDRQREALAFVTGIMARTADPTTLERRTAPTPRPPRSTGTITLVRATTLLAWDRLKQWRELAPHERVELADPDDARIVCVSHRWITPDHPDPHGAQLRELQQRLRTLWNNDELRNCLVFYDYCSVPQLPRNEAEEAHFRSVIGNIDHLFSRAERMIVLSEGYEDYRDRAWCFLEAIIAEHRTMLLDDQDAIKRDLSFLGIFHRAFVDLGISVVTAYDVNYRMTATESATLTAVFQHLRGCRTGIAEDRPLIKQIMLDHFAQVRMPPYTRVVLALNRYFDVTFGVLTPDGFLPCRTYFEEPSWVRLPPLESGGLLGAGDGEPSVFALAPADHERLRRHAGQVVPALRLSLSGMDDLLNHFARFQQDEEWEQYVVAAASLYNNEDDPFPTVRHLVHTLLEKFPPLGGDDDPSRLYFFLTQNRYDQDVAVYYS